MDTMHYSTHPAYYRRDVRSDMRAWLLDCFDSDPLAVETIEVMNHVMLADAVERHYEGGMVQFMEDGCYV